MALVLSSHKGEERNKVRLQLGVFVLLVDPRQCNAWHDVNLLVAVRKEKILLVTSELSHIGTLRQMGINLVDCTSA